MFGGILQFFMAGWWVKKKSPIIPRNKTGQIDLTASNLKKKSVAHKLHTLKKRHDYWRFFPSWSQCHNICTKYSMFHSLENSPHWCRVSLRKDSNDLCWVSHPGCAARNLTNVYVKSDSGPSRWLSWCRNNNSRLTGQ